jgi:DNA topoisomerase II
MRILQDSVHSPNNLCYTQLTQLEHILKRPDSYIGSVEAHTQHMWVYDTENKRMTNR